MKKKYLLFLLLGCLLPFNIYAADNFTVDNKNITVQVGKSATVKVTSTNSAGRLDITSSDNKIATTSKTSLFLDNDTQTFEIIGKQIGKTEVTVTATANYATYDEEILEGEKQTIIVNVVANAEQQIEVPDTAKNFSKYLVFISVIIVLLGAFVILYEINKEKKVKN